MSGSGPDFLASIAAKAVGAAPLVEPRLPSRFESRPEGAVDLAPAWEEPCNEALPQSPARPPRPVDRKAAEDMQPAVREARQAGDRTRPGPPPESQSASQARALAEPPPPAPAAPAPVVRPPAETARADEPPVVRAFSPPSLVVPARAGDGDGDGAARVTPRRGVEPAAPAAPQQDRFSRPVPEIPSSAVMLSAKLETPVAAPQPQRIAIDRAVRMPEVRPRPIRSDVRAAEPEPPAQAPVVNITIGRIEVRAAVAGATSPSRPAPAPRQAPQSLADYLKRRGGGR